MRVNLLFIVFVSLLLSSATFAQDAPMLVTSNTQIGTQLNIFEEESYVVTGDLYNLGTEAYTNINLYVEAYNADDELIGEGFGFLVDACGTALLDYAMPPERLQVFNAPFELFEDDDIASVQVIPEADAVPVPETRQYNTVGVTAVSTEEVVMLEWLDDDTMIYGVGCDDDVFLDLTWRQFNIADNTVETIEHPDAGFVTDAMLAQSGARMVTQSGEQNPELFSTSRMVFSPTGRRVIYQNDLHTVLSAEPDGSFKRLIHDGLHKHSLKGFLWSTEPGIFLAYYFGAYGEPVGYFIGNVEGNILSARYENTEPSLIVPGVVPDGKGAVVGKTVDGVTGYYLESSYYQTSDLLFEADLAGNNYPAPIVVDRADNRWVYVVRPVNDRPTLQCWDRNAGSLSDLTELPFVLSNEARAWSWLSPNQDRLAVAANGTDGGVWWVDLTAFDTCAP
jgi:hypothetical protein